MPEATPELRDRIERLQHAIEGEFDGLAITDEQAEAILRYVDGMEPLDDITPEGIETLRDKAGNQEWIPIDGIEYVDLDPDGGAYTVTLEEPSEITTQDGTRIKVLCENMRYVVKPPCD